MRPPDPDFGVEGWDWATLKIQAAAQGSVTIQEVRGADYRHAVAKEAARHGLYLVTDGPGAVRIVLGT